jgi:hypothetical protein
MVTITLQFTSLNAALRALREIPESLLASSGVVVEPTFTELSKSLTTKETPPAEPTIEEVSAALQAKNAIAQAATQEGKPEGKSRVQTAPSAPTAPVAPRPAAVPAKTAAASPPPAEPVAAAAPASIAAADVVAFEDLKKAFLALSSKKGRPGCEAVLKPFGVAKLSELAPEQYGEALELIKQQGA